MTHSTTIRRTGSIAASLLTLLMLLSSFAIAQVFRGGISDAVTDQSGAVVADAQVTAVETATNVSYKAITSSAGEFAFANLPLGSYSVTVKAEKFQPIKFDNIPVTAGVTYTFLWIFVVHGLRQRLGFMFRNHPTDDDLICQSILEAKPDGSIEHVGIR